MVYCLFLVWKFGLMVILMNDNFGEVFKYLLNNFIIVKDYNGEEYYKIKKNQLLIKEFVSKNLGSNLIIKENFIKLEKIPSFAKVNLGIKEFDSVLDYVILCLILLFLEDKVKNDVFVLTNLIDYLRNSALTLNFNNVPDWNLIEHRKSLTRVIDFLIDNNVIEVRDEDKNGFVIDKSSDALYSVTGISNYVMRVFNQDIFDHKTYQDFINDEWINQDDTRGDVRRYKVYRNILYTPVVYSNDISDSEFDYLKKLRNHMAIILSDFSYDLEVTKNMSLIYEYDSKINKNSFPNNRKITDIILMINSKLYKLVEENKLVLDLNEVAYISFEMFDNILREIRINNKNFLNKNYLNMSHSSFYTEVENAMISYGFIEKNENGYLIKPLICRYLGVLNNNKNDDNEQISLFGGEENV